MEFFRVIFDIDGVKKRTIRCSISPFGAHFLLQDIYASSPPSSVGSAVLSLQKNNMRCMCSSMCT